MQDLSILFFTLHLNLQLSQKIKNKKENGAVPSLAVVRNFSHA